MKDEELCKWEYDFKFEFAKSKCGFLDTHRFRFPAFNYCPFCGKKIVIKRV